MKKTIISLAMVSLMTISAWNVSAAPPDKKFGKNFGRGPKQVEPRFKDSQIRADAKYVIERTARVLGSAQRIAKRGRYQRGFGRAVAHQQRARDLYADGRYRDAIYFSLRSRELAIEIIEQNRQRPRSEFRMDKREDRYRGGPAGRDLDDRLDRVEVSKDKDALKIMIDLNL